MTDDERFEAIYRRRYARIWRYFRANRISDDESHDLAQETFQRFFVYMKQLRGADELPFVLSIARSVLLNHVRKYKTAKRGAVVIEIDDPDLRIDIPAPERGETGTDPDMTLRLLAAVGELSKGQQECLRLWLQGFSYEEIAKTLRITVDSVKSRLRDAKRFLRERLGGKR